MNRQQQQTIVIITMMDASIDCGGGTSTASISNDINDATANAASSKDAETQLRGMMQQLQATTVGVDARKWLARSSLNASTSIDGSNIPWKKKKSLYNVDEVLVEMRKKLWKYIRNQDRFLVLASYLLKSCAFYNVYHDDESCLDCSEGACHSLINLPRTKYNKPFIPRSSSSDNSPDEEDSNRYPLSVSHQYPFCGTAQWIPKHEVHSKHARIKKNDQLLVGFDIVVVEPLNTRLYRTVTEFAHALRENFTAAEFDIIEACRTDTNGNDQRMLRELYLQWAVKEAYTKALGVGMGFRFDTFETVFDFDSPSLATNSLGAWIDAEVLALAGRTESFDMPLAITGTIRHLVEPTEFKAYPGSWRFFFLPLSPKDTDSNSVYNRAAFACVCAGPVGSVLIPTAEEVFCQVQWTTFSDLMAWHTCPNAGKIKNRP